MLCIVTERVGQSIVISAESEKHAVSMVLSLAQATRLGVTLLAQSCLKEDGLELPESFRPTEQQT